jgi:hypothetical protein
VSGRKSDMLDCQWLGILHRYGLLPASFRALVKKVVFEGRLIESPQSEIETSH